MSSVLKLMAVVVVLLTAHLHAEDVVSRTEFEALKREMAEVRKESAELRKESVGLKEKLEPIQGSVAKALDAKYGPDAAVTTKNGKLTVSGLVQVWYYTIQNDHQGLFNDSQVNNITDINSTSDNDSFRVRRAELRFNLNLTEHLAAVVVLDPAREGQSYPAFPTNQGLFKRAANSLTSSAVTNVQTGAGAAPRMLQDVFINYHGIVPHHDFQVGQFKPPSFEDSMVSSAQLDFVERSFLGQLGDFRDQGAAVHGFWIDDRVQYWLGAFNGPGNLLQSGGQAQNRSDDNDAKDFVVRALFRPVWKHYTWGSLEFGGAALFGQHGESGSTNPIDFPTNGLNRLTTDARRFNAWLTYRPGGPVEGLWFKGEWGHIVDRNAPSSVIDVLGNDIDGNGTQDYAKPTRADGWNFSTGYKICDSIFAGQVPRWFKPFEFAFRYEAFENTEVANLTRPDHTNLFKTQVYTGGLNYYLKGHNAKIQLNYNHVVNPDSHEANLIFHNVRDDSLVVNFQVAW